MAHSNSLRLHSFHMYVCVCTYVYIFTTRIPKTKEVPLLEEKRIISYRCETEVSIKQSAWNIPHNCNFHLLLGPELFVAPASSRIPNSPLAEKR